MIDWTLRIMNASDVKTIMAADVFDGPPREDWVTTFLATPGHHLILAEDGSGQAVGFISGVEMTHPDKGTEMFLYELGVNEDARNQGIGRALVRALWDLAQERGCYGMWGLTETDNKAAQRTYIAAGAHLEMSGTVIISMDERSVPVQ
ncbi:MAG TPA: GNAT family N-acetyltransferase [Thermomicrobiales bacterium]|nr:GNAT family N-acetyltransferase [Thermomicrobiales bacterium]